MQWQLKKSLNLEMKIPKQYGPETVDHRYSLSLSDQHCESNLFCDETVFESSVM